MLDANLILLCIAAGLFNGAAQESAIEKDRVLQLICNMATMICILSSLFLIDKGA